jgi:hypothetical protein
VEMVLFALCHWWRVRLDLGLLFGIEKGTDALLSPTHLMLALGVLLAASGPFRAAWLHPPSGQVENLARLLSPLFA